MPHAPRSFCSEHVRRTPHVVRTASRGLVLLLLLGTSGFSTGCLSWIGKKESRTQTAAATAAASSPQGNGREGAGAQPDGKPAGKGFLTAISSELSKLNPFHGKKNPPPKALAPRRVGIIRTLSNDGSYVIVELEPGVSVSVGNALFVTKGGGDMDRLKVTDIQPPFFVADVQGGNPGPGDLVEQ